MLSMKQYRTSVIVNQSHFQHYHHSDLQTGGYQTQQYNLLTASFTIQQQFM